MDRELTLLSSGKEEAAVADRRQRSLLAGDKVREEDAAAKRQQM